MGGVNDNVAEAIDLILIVAVPVFILVAVIALILGEYGASISAGVIAIAASLVS